MRRLAIVTVLVIAVVAPPAGGVARADVGHQVLGGFQRAVQQYVELHRLLEAGLPPLAVTADAAQLRRAVDARAAAIREARRGARPGDVFTTEGGRVIRWRIHAAIDRNGYEASVLLRAMAADDEGGWPPLAINGSFPWLAGNEMWPFVIDVLPELPDELEYRFVGRDLVLLDIHAELVVDILPDALPAW